MIPAFVLHGIWCCVTHFMVPPLWRLQRSGFYNAAGILTAAKKTGCNVYA